MPFFSVTSLLRKSFIFLFIFLHGEVPLCEIFRRRFLSSDLSEEWSGVQTTLYALRIGIDCVFEPEEICSAREQKYRRDGKTIFVPDVLIFSLFLQLFSVNVESALLYLRRLMWVYFEFQSLNTIIWCGSHQNWLRAISMIANSSENLRLPNCNFNVNQ